MRPNGVPPDTRWNTLQMRAAIVLTIVLLPLGLLAVLQTQRAVEGAQKVYRADIVARTSRAVWPEHEAIYHAFGLAQGLAATVGEIDMSRAQCVELMESVVARGTGVGFAAYLDREARSRCNSLDQEIDFSANRDSQRLYAEPRSDISFTPSTEAGSAAAIVFNQPVYDRAGSFDGFVSLSFSALPLVELRERDDLPDTTRILIFNNKGEILTSDIAPDELPALLPADIELMDIVREREFVFHGASQNGEMRDFVLVPIVPRRAYALGSWERDLPFSYASPVSWSMMLFPVIMWLVTLVVVLLTLRHMVIRPIKTLRMRFRNFADGRSLLRGNSLKSASSELREIGGAFESLAEKVVRDEALLEDRIHERELLLREVHHRVKNNLQLMSSIINMQIRQADEPKAEEALQRVRGRLASLAKFHKDLYQTSSLAKLRVDDLLRDLVEQTYAMGAEPGKHIELRFDLDPVELSPDQASPLAMLATEAVTNALKYLSADPGRPRYVKMTLRAEPGDAPDGEPLIRLEIENSMASDAPVDGAGLGIRLIAAFASQLEAGTQHEHKAHCYLLTVVFRRKPFGTTETLSAALRHP